MGINTELVSPTELYDTASILIDGAHTELKNIEFKYGSSSVMPYDLDTMNDLLNKAAKKAADKYPFISKLSSNLLYDLFLINKSYNIQNTSLKYYTVNVWEFQYRFTLSKLKIILIKKHKCYIIIIL